MSEERKLILDCLGAVVAEKRLFFQGLRMQNTYGLNEVAGARLSMRFAQAQAELLNAESILRAEIARTLR